MAMPAPRRSRLHVTECQACPLNASGRFRSLSGPELDFIRHFKVGEISVSPGSSVMVEGARTGKLFTVLEGWGFRSKSLSDGRRQILNFVLPGDLIGLQSTLFSEMSHSVEALTELRLCIFRRERLWALYRDHPSLALDVTWLAARQEFVLDESLTSVGRRSARERVAHLLMWLYSRAEQAGLVSGQELAFPLTQQHFADALGLSLVHTNKTLRQLASEGVARWSRGTLKVLDAAALAAAGKWEPARHLSRPFI